MESNRRNSRKSKPASQKQTKITLEQAMAYAKQEIKNMPTLVLEIKWHGLVSNLRHFKALQKDFSGLIQYLSKITKEKELTEDESTFVANQTFMTIAQLKNLDEIILHTGETLKFVTMELQLRKIKVEEISTDANDGENSGLRESSAC